MRAAASTQPDLGAGPSARFTNLLSAQRGKRRIGAHRARPGIKQREGIADGVEGPLPLHFGPEHPFVQPAAQAVCVFANRLRGLDAAADRRVHH